MKFSLTFIQILFELMSLIIIARVLMSWFRPHGAPGPITRFIIDTSQPILDLAKRITPRMGMVDLSPIVALIGINLLERLAVYLITGA